MAFDSPGFVIDGTTCDAELFRRAIGTLLSPAGGIVTPGDLAVTQQTVPNMSVQIGTGQIWVPGTSTATQGPYYSRNGAAATQAINASDASNPRIDTILAQVQDAAYAGGLKQIAPGYVAGTPTAGATLVNLSGKGAVPASSLVLAYVLVPTSATSIVTADISNVVGTARAGMPALAYRAAAASLTANLGDFIVAAPGITVTLPSPSANPNGLVAIEANASVTGASPVTVAGTNIQGVGLVNASSFVLGSPGASVTLVSDGTNWRIISGQQDTGWVALTMSTNWNTNSGPVTGVYPASVRVKGNHCFLRGGIVNNTGSTAFSGTTMATLPTVARPAKTFLMPIYGSNAVAAAQLTTGPSGVVQYGDYNNTGLNNGFYVILDGVNFALTS